MRGSFLRSNLQTHVVERISWISNGIHMSELERTFHLSHCDNTSCGPMNQTSLVGFGALCGYDQRSKSDLEIYHWTEKRGKKLIIQTFIALHISASWLEQTQVCLLVWWGQHWIWWPAACVLGWDVTHSCLVKAHSIRGITPYWCMIPVLWYQNIALYPRVYTLTQYDTFGWCFCLTSVLLHGDCSFACQMENRQK